MKILSNREILNGNLTPWQVDILLSKAKMRIMLCGRQVGKSATLRAIAYHELLSKPNTEVLFVAKTHRQATEVAWRHLVSGVDPIIDPSLIKERNNSELYVILNNNSRLVVTGSENEDALLGRTIDVLLIDEFQSQKPDVWFVLQPMLAARNGRAVIAGTARGYDHLYDMWWKGWKENPNRLSHWRSWKIKTSESGTPAGSPEAIRAAKEQLSPKQYAQEYDASPTANKGAVYCDFDSSLNISSMIFDKKKPLYIGIDFNVNPMTAIVAQTVNVTKTIDGRTLNIEEIHVLDELFIENGNTSKMADLIRNKYSEWLGRIIVYPDPAGSARKTSATLSVTDHSILRQYFTVHVRNKHPAISDRVDAVNAMMCNVNGLRRLFVNNNCKQLVRSLIGQSYDSSGKPEKVSGLDHPVDALGYMIEYRYPVVTKGFTQHNTVTR